MSESAVKAWINEVEVRRRRDQGANNCEAGQARARRLCDRSRLGRETDGQPGEAVT
jgi:hypothetical protein